MAGHQAPAVRAHSVLAVQVMVGVRGARLVSGPLARGRAGGVMVLARRALGQVSNSSQSQPHHALLTNLNRLDFRHQRPMDDMDWLQRYYNCQLRLHYDCDRQRHSSRPDFDQLRHSAQSGHCRVVCLWLCILNLFRLRRPWPPTSSLLALPLALSAF